MKLSKSSPGLVAEFKAVAAQLRHAEPRKMFGYDALFVNGNMAVGLWQNTCVIKVPEADQLKLIKRGQGKPFCPMPNRPMTAWLELSEELSNDYEELLAWSSRAVDYVSTLPPKVRKATKTNKKRPVRKAAALAKKAATPRPVSKQKPVSKARKSR